MSTSHIYFFVRSTVNQQSDLFGELLRTCLSCIRPALPIHGANTDQGKISSQKCYTPPVEVPCVQLSHVSPGDKMSNGNGANSLQRVFEDADQQQLILPRSVPQLNQTNPEQTVLDAYALTAPELPKVNTKKNGPSRSCPPLKRDASPITKAGRNASHDRNHEQAQITTLSRVKESFQRERDPSRCCPTVQADGIQDEITVGANPPVPMDVQSVQLDNDAPDTRKLIIDLVTKFEQEEAEKS